MREHMGLFRGKRCDNGEWIEGYLTGALGGGFWIDESTKLGVPIIRRVDPNTVGECTGLKDKNGKLIFEGDVVIHGRDKFRVNYGRHDLWCCGCCFSSHESVGFYLEDNEYTPYSDDKAWHELEVIGNIHDNPELLKGSVGDGAP